jgi:GT2 family glycosyltransferase
MIQIPRAPTVVARPRALVADVDVARPLPTLAGADRAWVLVRAFTEPLGSMILPVPVDGLSPAALAEAVQARFGDAVAVRVAATGGAAGPLTAAGVRAVTTAPYVARRDEVLADAPPITVVICTRDRAEGLRGCLRTVLAQRYPRFRVLVVNNAPSDDSTEQVVLEEGRDGLIELIVEPRPGLSRARNAALAAAPGEILAYLDDDAEADPHWLAEVARALADHPTADVVSGPIVPAALETDAQLWFEQYGGHSKGRGFVPAVFSPATAHEQDPLYPLPPYGAGGNMVFRPGVLERLGGFDEALGAGTPAMGSEDTHVFMRLLHGGGTVVYQPGALVRHHSRRDLAGLRRQMYGYGAGLTAAYMSLVVARPTMALRLLRLVPTAARDLRSGASRRTAGVAADFPTVLLAENRRGMLNGPLHYLRGRAAQRREARA